MIERLDAPRARRRLAPVRVLARRGARSDSTQRDFRLRLGLRACPRARARACPCARARLRLRLRPRDRHPAHNVGPFAFIFSLALTGPASAGALDDAHVLVGLERATGVAFSHTEISYGGVSVTTDQTDGTLLWSQGGAAPYSMPRFAFDVVV